MRSIITKTLCVCAVAAVSTSVTGCHTDKQSPASAPLVTPQTVVPAVVATGGVIRIKAGSAEPFRDSSGNIWQADVGFSGGDMADRDPGTAIANTKETGLFLSEHYGMDYFSCSVPNGKYVAKLYFAETFEGITGPGQRVFSFNLGGHEFKDFDVWAKAGGPNKAYVETVPVEVTDGSLKITFTSNIENPEINAIEIYRE